MLSEDYLITRRRSSFRSTRVSKFVFTKCTCIVSGVFNFTLDYRVFYDARALISRKPVSVHRSYSILFTNISAPAQCSCTNDIRRSVYNFCQNSSFATRFEVQTVTIYNSMKRTQICQLMQSANFGSRGLLQYQMQNIVQLQKLNS
ncbi:Hypothetical_protein [Hexamita inflata]|uniref:Hypothetical_protein n=1 Tax=Hexamita inflata TaxID=28002 RepID=A0AA86UG45_9EUKA|nr:Hypothetical protein HINF_LOCUS7454 [Hexamita inflata]CAI9956815.1 Hypothetical protein HINF_LOCUS44460 [Hexamita inflata]